MIHPDFDGHVSRPFATMTPDERLDDLSAKIALVLELRKVREAANADEAGRRPSR